MSQKNSSSSNNRYIFRIDYSHDSAAQQLSQKIYDRLMSCPKPFSDLVILCIGTDRSTGDSLGPIVGSKLQELLVPMTHVYGTLDNPIHAVNLKETMDDIQNRYSDPLVIAIDACLGQFNNVGKITLAEGPLKPGAAVKKSLPEVGAFHLTGIVNIGGFMEYFVLQNTRLGIIMKMADVISNSLAESTEQYFKENENATGVL